MNASQPDVEYFLSSSFATHRYTVNTATIITLYSFVALFGFTANAAILGALLAHGGATSIGGGLAGGTISGGGGGGGGTGGTGGSGVSCGGSAANVFVGALALSDMVLCVFNVPTQLYYELGEPSSMSSLTCRVLFASLGIPTHVSCILILLIAIDRYRSVLHPLQPRRLTVPAALLLVCLSGLLSASAAFPVAYFTGVQEVAPPPQLPLNETANQLDLFDAPLLPQGNDSSGKQYPSYCVEQWPSAGQRLIYSILVVIGQFLTPLTATLFLYARIGCWLSKRRGLINRASSNLLQPVGVNPSQTTGGGGRQKPLQLAARLEARTKRTHRILVGIVACFAGCWTPWTLYSLYLECLAYQAVTAAATGILDEDQVVAANASLKMTDLFLKLFALSSACANPFLYGWLNENIRRAILRRVSACWQTTRCPHNNHNNNPTVTLNAANSTQLIVKNQNAANNINRHPPSAVDS